MRWMHAVVGGSTLAVALAWGVASAGADLTSPPGRCAATASFGTGLQLDSRTLDPGDSVTVPLQDTVSWTGELTGVAEGEREISGEITIQLFWPAGSVSLGSWEGTATKTAAAGVDTYDLPSITPRGVPLKVEGVHREDGRTFCTGSLTVEVEGSATDSPLTYASLGLTALSGVGLVAVGRTKVRRLV